METSQKVCNLAKLEVVNRSVCELVKARCHKCLKCSDSTAPMLEVAVEEEVVVAAAADDNHVLTL
jgi:hypothetical protein